MDYKGSNNLARLLYDTNCEMQVVNPQSINQINSEKFEREVVQILKPTLISLHKKFLDSFLKEFNYELNEQYQQVFDKYIEMNYYEVTSVRQIVYHYFGEFGFPVTASDWEYRVRPWFNMNEHNPASQLIRALRNSEIENLIGYDWVNKSGKFPKRFSSMIYKMTGEKLSVEQLTEIGNLYDRCRYSNKNFYVRLTNNFDWRDGQYGKDGSCWWASYGSSRDTLHEYGGMACLFYPDETSKSDSSGIGRMWIYPQSDDVVAAFNYYGPEQSRHAAAVVARLLEQLTNEPWVFGSRGVSSVGGMYVNGDSAFVIYRKNAGLTIDSEFCFHFHEVSKGTYFECGETCENCGNSYDEDEMTYVDGRGYYCDDCLSDNFFCCDRCGEYESRDSMYIFEDRDSFCYCESCFDHLTSFTCDGCGTSFYYDNGTTTEDTNNTYCENCLERENVVWCEHGYFENGCEECAEEEKKNEELE